MENSTITAQEAWTERDGLPVQVPPFIAEVVERVAFLARDDKRVDKRSGVSQRMPISVMETAVSNAERRALVAGEARIVPRVADVYAENGDAGGARPGFQTPSRTFGADFVLEIEGVMRSDE